MEQAGKKGIYVTLNYPPLGLVGATAAALRPDSIYVDTGAITLPHHAEVEVTLSYRQDKRLQVHRVAARVTGRGAEGTELTFDDDLPGASHQAMQALVAHKAGAASLEGVA